MIGSDAVEVRRFDGSEWSSELVMGVLPGASSTEGSISGSAATVVEFHFPRGYGDSLALAWFAWRGRMFQVLGDPQPYLERNVPGRWSMPVRAVARSYPEPLRLTSVGTAQDDFGRVSRDPSPVWAGTCRQVSAEEAEAWRAGSPGDEPEAVVAIMPDAAVTAARPGASACEYGGATWDVAGIAWTGGVGSEVALTLRGRSDQ